METIINLPQTSFVSHDIKWIEFRTQIASAHAQRVWIKFDQIAHALFGFNLGRRRKNVELVIFKEGSGQCCLALHVGADVVFYTKDNAIIRCGSEFQFQSRSGSYYLTSLGEPVLSWQIIINSFFCGGRFSNLIINSRIASKEWIVV